MMTVHQTCGTTRHKVVDKIADFLFHSLVLHILTTTGHYILYDSIHQIPTGSVSPLSFLVSQLFKGLWEGFFPFQIYLKCFRWTASVWTSSQTSL